MFYWQIGSNAAEVLVKFQNDRAIPNSNFDAASRLCEILQLDVLWDIETGPSLKALLFITMTS